MNVFSIDLSINQGEDVSYTTPPWVVNGLVRELTGRTARFYLYKHPYDAAPIVSLTGTPSVNGSVTVNGGAGTSTVSLTNALTRLLPGTIGPLKQLWMIDTSKPVMSVAVTSGGSYTTPPTVTLIGGGGFNATATANILNGTVVSVTITDGGYGYTSTPAVVFSPSGAVAVATVSAGTVSVALNEALVYIQGNVEGEAPVFGPPVPVVAGGAGLAVMTQNTWYFDFFAGNDANDGLTAETALLTWTTKPDGTLGEYVRRTGANPLIDQTVQYYLLTSMPPTDQMSLLGVFGPNGQILVHGVPTVKRSGTLSAVTNRSPSTNVRDQLFDGSIDWTDDIGSLVQVDTNDTIVTEGVTVAGPTRGWIAKAELSPNCADMSIMGSRSFTPANPLFMWPGPLPAGATYSVLILPSVPWFYVDPRLGPSAVAGDYPNILPCVIELLDFPYLVAIGAENNNFIFAECSFDSGFYAYAGYFFNCNIGVLAWDGYITSIFGLVGTSVSPGYCSGTGYLFSYGLMMQGPGTQMYAAGSDGTGVDSFVQNHHAAFGFGVYDCDTPFIIGATAAFSSESNIYGTGITTCVFQFQQGGFAVDNNPYTGGRPTIRATGAPSDMIINNQTSLPAMDPTTYALTELRALTFDNLLKTVASGGFEGIVFDPRSPSTRYEFAHP